MASKRSRRRKQQASTSQITSAPDGSRKTPAEENSGAVITATAPAAADTTLTTPDVAARMAATKNGTMSKSKTPPQSDFAALLSDVARSLGSVKLAVVLLSTFTLIVFAGIYVEHRFSTQIAQDLVYEAWWFNFLLFMLAVNIFFAAVKKMQFNKQPLHLPALAATTLTGKVRAQPERLWLSMSHYWPWKRHQFGFLVTHVGLITMLSGGVINNFFGVDAYVTLVDTSDPKVRAEMTAFFGRVPQTSKQCYYSNVSQIHLIKTNEDSKTKTVRGDFSPGALPWRSRAREPEARPGFFISVLNWLQQPLGHNWSLAMKDGTWVEVLDYIPMAQQEEFVKDSKGDDLAFKLQLGSPKIPFPVEGWLSPKKREFQRGGRIKVEFVGKNLPQSLIGEEFVKPPSPDELGEMGVLAVHLEGQRIRLPVADNLNKLIRIKGTPFEIKLTGKGPVARSISFDVFEGGAKTGSYQVHSLLNELILRQPIKGGHHAKPIPIVQGAMGLPLFWYHAPDIREGNKGMGGVLQFVTSRDGRMYYRSYALREKGFVVEKAGQINPRETHKYPIWGKMKWAFRILQYFPKATAKKNYTPASIALGKATESDKKRFPSVIKCRLHLPRGKKEVFWVEEQYTSAAIAHGDNEYRVRFTYKSMDLGFEIRLDRAEQTSDPGTQRAASYSSWVRLYDRPNRVNGRREHITMNEPLEYSRLTFYQSDLRLLPFRDVNGKPVNFSGFTVASDPGLALKYLGSCMLGLGIFLMFYMRAYFFKPRGRKGKIDAPATA